MDKRFSEIITSEPQFRAVMGHPNAIVVHKHIHALDDYCRVFIRAVPADDPTAEPRLLLQDVGNLVSFGELDDGELVVLTAAGVQRVLPP